MTSLGGKSLATLLAALVVASLVAPAVAVAGATGSTTDGGSDSGDATFPNEEQFVEVDEESGASVWDRSAALPLRVDRTGAPTRVETPQTSLRTSEGDATFPSTFGVHGPDETLELEFTGHNNAPTHNFDGEEMDLLVATGDPASMDSMLDPDGAADLLTGHPDVRYELINASNIDGGDLTVTYDLSGTDRGAGNYAFFLVNESSYDVDEKGDVENVSNPRIVGMDAAVVQEDASSVEPEKESYDPGETVDLDVESGFDDGNTTHAVVLFDEEDLTEDTTGGTDEAEQLVIEYEGDVDDVENASMDDFTLESSIGAAHGSLAVEEDVELFGETLDAQEHAGEFDPIEVLDPLVGEVNLSDLDTTRGDTVLNASVTAVSGADAKTTVEVDTLGNWTGGEYDVLHVAVDEETGAIETDRSSVVVGSDALFVPTIDEEASETHVEAGEDVVIEATVKNHGDVGGTKDVEMYFRPKDHEDPDEDWVLRDEIEGLTLESGESTTLTFTTETGPEDAGEYHAKVYTEGHAEYETPTVDVTIERPSGQPDETPPPVAAPAGAPPAPAPDPEPDPDPAGPAVQVEPDENAASVAFENVPSGESLTARLPDNASDREAGVTGISVTTASDHERIDMRVEPSESAPEGAPDLDVAEPMSYLSVDVDVDDTESAFEDVEFEFTVSPAALEERGVEPERVHLYRYGDGEWQQLPTERVDEETYVAASPGFSAFAIGTERQPSFEVSDATLGADEVEPGEDVTVSAVVENTGDGEGSYTAEFAVDGEVVETVTVDLGPGENREVTYTHTFEEPGTYQVDVSGEVAGSVSVEAPEEPAELGFLSPGVVIAGVLLLLLVTSGTVYYVRRSDDLRVDLPGRFGR